MKKTRLFVALAAVLALTLRSATPAGANHSWAKYHWARTSNPFTLQLINQTTTTGWSATLGAVSTDWSKSTVLDTAVKPGTPEGEQKCTPQSGRVVVCNDTYGLNQWLGLARIWFLNTHITQATSQVNDTYFVMENYDNPNAKRHVMCQEVGHTFGLGHQKGVTNSCMNDQGKTLFLSSAISPNQHDYDQLVEIYGHNDTTSTAAKGGAVGVGADWTPPASDHGRQNVYVHDLGEGRLLIVFVTWTP